MKLNLIAGVFITLSMAAAYGADHTSSFTGEISDSQCATRVHSRDGSHSAMLKLKGYGRTPADCSRACVRDFGGRFVLVVGKKGTVYHLEPQAKVEPFAGRRVTIEGSLDRKTKSIHVADIKPVP